VDVAVKCHRQGDIGTPGYGAPDATNCCGWDLGPARHEPVLDPVEFGRSVESVEAIR
jgi:hypothetical protein